MKRLNMEEEPGKDHWKESSVAVVEKSSSHLMQFFLPKMKKLGTEIPDVVVASVDSIEAWLSSCNYLFQFWKKIVVAVVDSE